MRAWWHNPYVWWAVRYGMEHAMPVNRILGIVSAEGWNASAPTWEPTVQEHSYGPMQILGSTARDMGYTGDLARLHEIRVGMRYGTKYLADRHRRYGDTCRAISAYNAGRPIAHNLPYVCRAAPYCVGC